MAQCDGNVDLTMWEEREGEQLCDVEGKAVVPHKCEFQLTASGVSSRWLVDP